MRTACFYICGRNPHLIILPSETKTLTRDVSDKIMSLAITLINFDNNSDVDDVSRLQYRKELESSAILNKLNKFILLTNGIARWKTFFLLLLFLLKM